MNISSSFEDMLYYISLYYIQPVLQKLSPRNYRPEIIAHIIAVCGRLINMKVSGHHVIHHQINLGAKSDSSPYHRTFLMAIYDTFMEKHIY